MIQELVFSRPWAGAVSMAALLGTLAGCGGTAADPEDSATNVTVVLSVLSGDVQTGLSGEELAEPVRVRAQQDGAPWVNKTINFVVTVGGGSVLAGTVLTDSEGVAQEFWTLGGPGEQALEARAVSSAGERLTFRTIRATAISPPTLTIGSADTSRAFMGSIMLPTPLVVARDAFGNPMNMKDITWTASAGDLGVPGLTSGVTRTSPDGIAVIQWWAAQAPGFATMTASMIDDLTGDTIYLEEPFVGVTEQTATWIAEFGALNWSDGANWDIGRPPGPGELANLSASGSHTVTLDVSASVASILRTVRDANGDPFRSTGTKELVIPLGSFLVLTDTLVRADLPKVVLDGGGLTTSSGSMSDAEIHWTSGQLTMDRGGNGQSFSMFASGVGTKLLDVAPKVSATDSDVGINRITWDDASEWRIRGGPKLLFRNDGITVRGGNPLPGFGQMSVVSDDGLKPTLELTAPATIAFQFVGSTPSTIILTGVDFVVGPSMSFTVEGDLPAIGQFYDLILLQGGSTFSSGAIPSNANYEFQVNPVSGVGLRAIRRQ